MSTRPISSATPPFIRFFAWFLRVFFHLLYHQFSWAYDLVAWVVSIGRWKGWVLSALPYLTGPDVLEIGHGPGHLQIALNQSGISGFGLDESKQMGHQAQRRLNRQGYCPRLINGLSQHLPFPNNRFSQVVSTFPSEYIFDPQTLAEIYRVLIPGGIAIILPWAWITGDRSIDRAAAWLFRVTGETPIWDDHLLEPARTAGFSVSSEAVNLASSRLLFLHLRKPL